MSIKSSQLLTKFITDTKTSLKDSILTGSKTRPARHSPPCPQ